MVADLLKNKATLNRCLQNVLKTVLPQAEYERLLARLAVAPVKLHYHATRCRWTPPSVCTSTASGLSS
eukprot:4994038-Alexandrium_andersonii.AAC.1